MQGDVTKSKDDVFDFDLYALGMENFRTLEDRLHAVRFS